MHSRSLSVREIGKKIENEEKDHNGTSQKNFISFTQGIKTDPVFFESGSPSVSDRKKMFLNSPSTPKTSSPLKLEGLEKGSLTFEERKKQIQESLLKQTLPYYSKPVFVVESKVSEVEILETMMAYEKDFLARVDTLEMFFLPYFMSKSPNIDIKQLWDCGRRLAQSVIALKGVHTKILDKLTKGELAFWEKDDFAVYVEYLRNHKGFRLFLNVLVEKSPSCKETVMIFNNQSKLKQQTTQTHTLEELCSLPAVEISKYLKFYDTWMYMRPKDSVAIKDAQAVMKAYLNENHQLIHDIYQQEKVFAVQQHLGVPEIANVLYTGTSRRCKASLFIHDGMLEIIRGGTTYSKCQVFIFDKLFIIHESEIIGNKTEYLPIVKGDFSVDPLDQNRFKVTFDDDVSRLFSAATEEEKGKWIRVLGKINGEKLDGEKELFEDLMIKTEQLDSPQSYYLNNLNAIVPYKELPADLMEYSEGSTDVKCATFEKLIELLANPAHFDYLYVYTFLLTYRNFTTCLDVMDALQKRYNTGPKRATVTETEFVEFKTNILLPIRMRVVQVLGLWLTSHGRDFRSDAERDRLLSFVDEMTKTKIGVGADQLNTLSKKYVAKRDTFEVQRSAPGQQGKSTHFLLNLKALPKPELPTVLMNMTIKDPTAKEHLLRSSLIEITEWSSLEVARQLSLLEFSIFERIQGKECLNQSWNKENREAKAPNIHKMIAQTNTLANWTANEILKNDKVANRAKFITKFLEIAQECRKLNNFNSMMGILGGLNSIGVKRIEKSWNLVKEPMKKIKAELDELVSRAKSYGQLRNTVRVSQPPILPYMGLYLTDLTFIEDSNKNTLNDKINFSKCRRLAKVIREIQIYQGQPYEFLVVYELLHKFETMHPPTEEQLIELSYRREAKQ